MKQQDLERTDDSRVGEALQTLTRGAVRKPGRVLAMVAATALLAVGLTVAFIDFKAERSDLIDPQAEFHQRWMDYTESFGNDSDLVVVVEADEPETIKQALDDLGSRMQQQPDLFRNILYKVEPGRLRDKGLQFLSPEQLEAGLNQLQRYRPLMQGHWNRLRLQTVLLHLRDQLSSHRAAASSEPSRRGQREQPLQQAYLLSTSLAAYLQEPSDFRSPWPELLAVDPRLREEARQVVYFLNDSGTMGFLRASPAGKADGFRGNTKAIDRLREIVDRVSVSYPEARLGVTGIPVLENDEMRRSQADMLTASIISFVGVGLLLLLGFRGYRHPAIALLMLAVGMSWAFGYTTLAVGHLNILSVSFAAILIGLGIDFGIHYLARYLELRHRGDLLRPALLRTSSTVGTGIVTAAVTTALAFFCASFTQFLGVAELGIIAGGGVLLCALATFVVVPAAVALADQHVEPRKLPTPFEGQWLCRITSRRPWAILGLSSIAILALGLGAFRFEDGSMTPTVRYDHNLINLQADGLESVEVQRRLFRDNHRSLLYAVSVADTPQEARRLRDKFEQLPTVHHVTEVASKLPDHPPRETRLMVQAYHSLLADLPQELPEQPAPDPARVGRALEGLYRQVRDRNHPLARQTAQTLDRFFDHFEKLTATERGEFLASYQHEMQADLLDKFHMLKTASNPDPVTRDDLPPELTSRFVSPQGKWLLQIYPEEQVWDLEPLKHFVTDLRSVDPDVTGTPLQNYEASRQIKNSYMKAALYALIAVFVVLLLDFLDREDKLLTVLPPAGVVLLAVVLVNVQSTGFDPVLLVLVYGGMALGIAAILDPGNLRDALMTLLPAVAGGGMMFGILGLLGIDLNPANLIVLPLVLGIGVDDGVHVLHDFRLQMGDRSARYRTSSSTINAIVLTSLTSMIGFGSMMVAAHRGLYSVGLVLVIGVGSCLFVSLVPLPALLSLVSGNRPDSDETGRTESDDSPDQPQLRIARVA